MRYNDKFSQKKQGNKKIWRELDKSYKKGGWNQYRGDLFQPYLKKHFK